MRTKDQLLAAYQEQYKTPFDVAPFTAFAAIVGESAAEAALLKKLRELLPTANQQPDRDYVAEFWADAAAAAAFGTFRTAATALYEHVKRLRDAGSKITIDTDMLAENTDGVVEISARNRIKRNAVKRDFSRLTLLLQENDVKALSFTIGKDTITFNVKYGQADAKKNYGGALFLDKGKWHAIETIKEHVAEYFTADMKAGNRKTDSFNVWVTVRTDATDENDKALTLADLYDDKYPQVIEETPAA